MKEICTALVVGLVSCVTFATEQDIESNTDFTTSRISLNRLITFLPIEMISQEEKINESFKAYEDICKKLNMEPRIRYKPAEASAEESSQNAPEHIQGTPHYVDNMIDNINTLSERLPWMLTKPPYPNGEEDAAFENLKQAIKKWAMLDLIATAAIAEGSLSLLEKIKRVSGSNFQNLLDSES